MSPHPLVSQLRFARVEMLRALEGVSDEDSLRRLGPMNSLGWIVGHLADQENLYWVVIAQGKNAAPGLRERVGHGKPSSTPPLSEMLATWKIVTREADQFLDTLTPHSLHRPLEWRGKPVEETAGTWLLRNIYHYWYHLGESQSTINPPDARPYGPARVYRGYEPGGV